MKLLFLLCLLPLQAFSGPQQQTELQQAFNLVQHKLSNQQAELKTFEAKLSNFEQMLETLRDDIERTGEKQKESLHTRGQSLELRIAGLEQASQHLTAEMKQLSKEVENALTAQNRNLANLQNAVSTLVDTLQGKSDSSYKVKNGDSLEKIAKAHQTNVQTLKDLNGISSDKIRVGQTLKVPN